ncbi:equilibrative nucleoside transporter 1 [Sitodiplosis mosellana]|uniref:equilibrative nucleoside transporter 1 n=1 Tax=Sitodiplosis mosellana TaxID=263140 RepID=UPI00244430BB|nr:equilibrative nucleoside transporter 1 [Sitodiplosis mosellana]XP_055323263.1 equilibrative nucleoside transporter 1 [Sitodiplosis mosellana]XP_055323264.1 equilibrative nucleoside transporter 1 [Sitodiplosis mosellana]XP_055323265.1 equilibrative nucleoside transporter 1 [Sitodiplosis mosellana]XP_055323267.1 equilibrative nucleoside transporter 1 [Sitodiplosis mosellana]XP_055323268.1 equilibrative nucleoside transporter 1 [Sitodiplosis mosellana]XP_055323269.1 equilibrative nucleoside t
MFREEETLLAGAKNGNAPTIVSNGSNGEVEKAPFIAKPVRLTPAWEANNLPNDELNFRGMTMERATLEINPPRDKLNIIFFILVLHGIGTLMPWNMFINANDYFVKYKLNANYTHIEADYDKDFQSYMPLAAQIPNVILNWLNIFFNLGGNLTPRIVWSIIIEVIVFIVTVGLAMVDSQEWPGIFFWVTMTSVVILNIAGGIYQNSVYGMASKLPAKYVGAVVLGSNISGAFTSVINILSTYFTSSVRTAAIYYFIGAMFALLACFDTYFALPLNRFYRYHELMNEKEVEKARKLGGQTGRPPYWTIFKQAFPQLFNVFFIFFITLSLFPNVQLAIEKSDPNFWVPDNIYMSVLCFLTFNISAMLGSLTTSWVQWPKKEHLIWPVLLRVAFIPLFLFANYKPYKINRVLPIYIKNDWAYWGIGFSMAYTSGYLSALGMMYAPQTVPQQHAQTAGMFAAAMLITGIFAGISSSTVFPFIVSNVSW